MSYKANREANGFQAGNVAEFDASLQYRLWPSSLGAGVPAFLYGVPDTEVASAGALTIRPSGTAWPPSAS